MTDVASHYYLRGLAWIPFQSCVLLTEKSKVLAQGPTLAFGIHHEIGACALLTGGPVVLIYSLSPSL